MAYVKDMQNFVSREDIFLIKQPLVAKKTVTTNTLFLVDNVLLQRSISFIIKT